jgi:hypothetical protein
MHYLPKLTIMKNTYMVECELLGAFSKEFMALVPHQRYITDLMMEEGIIQSYSLSLDRAKLWIVISAESDFEVLEEMSRMPLIDFMIPHVSQLMFYNPSSSVEPILQFSLN